MCGEKPETSSSFPESDCRLEDSGYESVEVDGVYSADEFDAMESLNGRDVLRANRGTGESDGVRGLASEDSSDDTAVLKALRGRLTPRALALSC